VDRREIQNAIQQMKTEEAIKDILQSKYWSNKKIFEVNGVYFPEKRPSGEPATGNHMGWSPNSKQYKKYMSNLLNILKGFHQFAEENNVLYSLNGGTLMGYYWNKNIIPWDDDIDIWLQEKDYYKIRDKLWDEGESNNKNLENATGWYKKNSRIIKLGNKKYEIIPNNQNRISEGTHLTKILPLNMPKNRKNIGGLDIGMCRTCQDKSLKEGWMKDRGCFIPENPKEKDFPIVDFSGIKTRAVIRKLGEPLLNEVYGPKWKIPCHPIMKTKININEYL